MGVARDLRQSGRAAGVEARRDVAAADATTGHQPIAWLPFELAGEWQHVIGECLILPDGEHGAQTRHVSAKRIDPFPERQAERMAMLSDLNRILPPKASDERSRTPTAPVVAIDRSR